MLWRRAALSCCYYSTLSNTVNILTAYFLRARVYLCNNWRMAEKMARTSITIPESLLERFKELCQAQRRSVSAQLAWMMEEALRQSETQNQASDS